MKLPEYQNEQFLLDPFTRVLTNFERKIFYLRNPFTRNLCKFCERWQYCLPFKNLHGSTGPVYYKMQICASFFCLKIYPDPNKRGLKVLISL